MSMMTNFLAAILKFIQFYPDAKLTFIYRLTIRNKDGSKTEIYTQDRKFVRLCKRKEDVKIKRKLMCRTLY